VYTLLVDDEPEHMILFKDYLEKCGHKVDAAATKVQAMSMLATNRYDVAAVDLVLVMATGDTIARAAFDKGVGVVVMSASGSSIDDLVTTLELHGCKVSSKLKKPFPPKVLLMALEQAFLEKSAEQVTAPEKRDDP
jgi:DNA-binding response OmpR family regulator